jgi:hypothetical protein
MSPQSWIAQSSDPMAPLRDDDLAGLESDGAASRCPFFVLPIFVDNFSRRKPHGATLVGPTRSLLVSEP